MRAAGRWASSMIRFCCRIVYHGVRMKRTILLLGLALGGCAVGPDYHPPPAVAAQQAPEAFTVDGVAWKKAEPAAQLPRGKWWTLFEDGEVNRLEDWAATQNQNLAASAAALQQARELVVEARSQYFPQLAAAPSATRQ